MRLEVMFGPADFERMPGMDLADAACVVFDVLRATSSVATAFAAGARSIRPVAGIPEALGWRSKDAGILLAGERDGLRIGPELTGGVPFDLGNSPREFTREAVAGRDLVMTTTNGTRALRACAGAGWVATGAMLNLGAVVRAARSSGCGRGILVASGTGECTALEDVLAVGAAIERWMAPGGVAGEPGVDLADSAWIALGAWRSASMDHAGAGSGVAAMFRRAANARRLLGLPALAEDVEICLRTDRLDVVPRMGQDGVLVCG